MKIDNKLDLGDTIIDAKTNNKCIISSIYGYRSCDKTYAKWNRKGEITYGYNKSVFDSGASILTMSDGSSNPVLVDKTEAKMYETKYNIGDVLYYMQYRFNGNRIEYYYSEYYKFNVTKINFYISESEIKFGYMEGNNGCGTVHEEGDLFLSLGECTRVANVRTDEFNLNL